MRVTLLGIFRGKLGMTDQLYVLIAATSYCYAAASHCHQISVLSQLVCCIGGARGKSESSAGVGPGDHGQSNTKIKHQRLVSEPCAGRRN